MKVRWQAVLCLGLFLLLPAVWFGWIQSRPPAAWLHVEAPRQAIVGESFPVRVTLRNPESGTRLGVDLHWASSRREPRGFLATSPRQAVEERERTYRFDLPVAPREDLGNLFAIVFLSPSGRWDDRTAAVETPLVPVRTSGTLGALEAIPVHSLTRGAVPLASAAPSLRWAIAALWFLTGFRLWRHRGSGGAGWLALACLVAALWELANAEVALAGFARVAALDQRLYAYRHWLQSGATLAIVSLTIVLVITTLLRAPVRNAAFLVAALWLYAGISLASLVSFHETDRWLASPVFTVPFAQVAKLGIAVGTLGFGLRSLLVRRQ